MRVTSRPNTAEETSPTDLDRASEIEIQRPNETRDQRRNSTKRSCRKIRTNTAADRPPDAKKFGDTQNSVSSGNQAPVSVPSPAGESPPTRASTPGTTDTQTSVKTTQMHTHILARTQRHTYATQFIKFEYDFDFEAIARGQEWCGYRRWLERGWLECMSRNGTSKTTVIKHSDSKREKNKRDKKNQEEGRKMLAKLKEDPSRKEGY